MSEFVQASTQVSRPLSFRARLLPYPFILIYKFIVTQTMEIRPPSCKVIHSFQFTSPSLVKLWKSVHPILSLHGSAKSQVSSRLLNGLVLGLKTQKSAEQSWTVGCCPAESNSHKFEESCSHCSLTALYTTKHYHPSLKVYFDLPVKLLVRVYAEWPSPAKLYK